MSILTSRAVRVALVLPTFSIPASAVTTQLIEGGKNSGNGDFIYDTSGEFTVISSFGDQSGEIREDLSRNRLFRVGLPQGGSFAGVTGEGITTPGWTITRVLNGSQLSGGGAGNPAFGLDANYGFAPTISSGGQAFVNRGQIQITSDPITFAFESGQTLDLSYLLGSDTVVGGVALAATSEVALLFQNGATNFEETFPLVSRTGIDLVANLISESLTLTQSADTVRLQILLSGDGNGGTEGVERGIIDQVRLSVTDSIPEPSSTLLIGLGTLGFCLRRRR